MQCREEGRGGDGGGRAKVKVLQKELGGTRGGQEWTNVAGVGAVAAVTTVGILLYHCAKVLDWPSEGRRLDEPT